MNIRYKSKDINMLTGNVLPKVIAFIIPLLLTNLLQTFYSAADMIIVGMSDVSGAVGSIGTTNAYINLLINIFVGFSVGANIVIAKKLGSGNKFGAERAVHTSVAVSVIFGIVCMVIGLFVSRSVLSLLGDEGHILNLATTYTTYYFIGVPFLSLSNNLIAIFRAKGDTKTPLIVLSVAGLLNIGLNLLFVLAFGMSVDGVAIATAASNMVSCVVLIYLLTKENGWCRFSFRKLKISKAEFIEILRVGIPASIQGILFSISNMLIQSSIIGINNKVCPGGSAIIDGNAAATSIEGFIYTAINAINIASATFTSQHFGAKMYKRIGKVMKSCYFVAFAIAVVFAGVIIVLRKPLIGLYISEELAIKTATTRILIMISPYFTIAFMEVGSGIIRGLDKSLISTVNSLIGACFFRIAWIYTVFALFPKIEIIYLSYPISWLLTAAVNFIFAYTLRKKYMKTDPESN